MSTLERWLPFKFRRKNTEEKKAEGGGEIEARSPQPQAQTNLASLLQSPLSLLGRSALDDSFFQDPFSRLSSLDRWFGDFSPARFQPNVDVVDEEGALRVTAELPGMSKDDVKLSIQNDVLTIRGEKKNEEESRENGVYRTERYYGYTQRAVPLPANVDHDAAEAKFDKGVLTVRFPKRPEKGAAGKDIPVG